MLVLQASQPDELTIDEQEMLEVIEDGDMEDWVKVGRVAAARRFYLAPPVRRRL